MMSGLPPGISPLSPVAPLLVRAGQLIEQERFLEAIEPMAEAAALQPDNPRIHADLGGLYVETDRHAEAVAPLRKAIRLNPRIAIAHWRLGTALYALGNTDGAIAAIEQALQLRPGLTEAHAHLALLYIDKGRRRDAIVSCRRAAESATEPGEKQLLEAQALVFEGREPEAEPLLRSALAAQPDLPTAHGLLAEVLASCGRFEEASRHYEVQVARTPRAGLCYYSLVRSRKITEADAGILQSIDSVLGEQYLNDINRAVLLLARAKALDDLGRYEEAMKAVDAAAELRARAFSPDVGKFERQVDAIIALFSRERLVRYSSENRDQTPVLILGMPRSGTTLLEQILSSHPWVAGAGELGFWRNRLQPILDARVHALDTSFLQAAAAEYLQGLHDIAPTASRVTDKDPFNFLAIGLIHMALPGASIIHCRRNPVDAAISIRYTHFSRTVDVPTRSEDLVRYFRAQQRLMAHWNDVLPAGRIFEVEYERLTTYAGSEIPRLVEYVGLPWDPACLTPHVNVRVVRTPSGWQVRQSINKASVDRWRRYEAWLGPLAALRTEAPQPAPPNSGTSG
jgi:tetratricopeptide (TPR) repeat protein